MLEAKREAKEKAREAEIYEKYQPESSRYMTREERKALTKNMRESGVFSEEHIACVKMGLKQGYSSFIARFVMELSSTIITLANQDEQATFLVISGKKTRRELGSEGSRITLAIQALKALDSLIAVFLIQDPEKKQQLRDDLREIDVLRYGLGQYKDKASLAFINNLLVNEETVSDVETSVAAAMGAAGIFSHKEKAEALSSELEDITLSDAMVNHAVNAMIDLFDFDYYKRLSTMMLESFMDQQTSMKKESEESKVLSKLIKELIENDPMMIVIAIKGCIGVEFSDDEKLMASKHKKKLVVVRKSLLSLLKSIGSSSNDLEDMFDEKEKKLSLIFTDVCQKHLSFIFVAFRQLSLVTPKMTQQFVYGFIDGIIEKQGWRNMTTDDFDISALYESAKNDINNLLLSHLSEAEGIKLIDDTGSVKSTFGKNDA